MSLDLNPHLLEALRAQSGTAANPALQALLSQIDPSTGNDALPSIQELLSQLESTNPTAGLIAKYLAVRQAYESESNLENEAEAEEQGRAAEAQRLAFKQSERLAQVVQRLQQQVKMLRTELEQLRARNDALAAALGACYLCWGQDSGCPVCHGTWRPGSVTPDGQLFTQFVGPAIRMLQRRKEVRQNDSKTMQSGTSTQDLIWTSQTENGNRQDLPGSRDF